MTVRKPAQPAHAPSFSHELNTLAAAVERALRARAGGAALGALAGAGLVLAPAPALAATFTVDSTTDASDAVIDGVCATAGNECTLRAAIEEANANDNGPGIVDEVLFDSTVTGTITLNGTDIPISDELTITGPGANELAVSGNDISPVFIASGATSLTSISGLTLTDGYTDGGGGAMFSFNDISLEGVAVLNSYAGVRGGGFLVNAGTATLNNCTVSGNASVDKGGGFYVGSGDAILTNSTVSGNSVNNLGGGFYVSRDANLTNSTVSGNTSGSRGGGFYAGFGDVFLAHSTVSGNTADNFSGGFDAPNDVSLTNSVIANNAAPSYSEFRTSFGSVVASYSLVEGSSSPSIVGGTDGNITGQDPQLASLQDNGGTTFTHSLASGSPAIDAGDPGFASPPATDQRGPGFSREVGAAVDMGAFEVQAPAPGPNFVVTSNADTGDGVCSTTHCTLREAVGAANASAGADEITFDSTVTGMIVLNGNEISITEEITITGPGANVLTVDADDQSRIFSAASTASQVTVTGLALANGYSPDTGGAVYSYNALSLDGVAVRDSQAYDAGGGVFATGNVTVANSTVSGNSTQVGDGGGIYVSVADAEITNSTISNNTAATSGGGLYVFVGDATIANSTISSNTAQLGEGGGFYLTLGGVTLSHSIISGNVASIPSSNEFYIQGGVPANASYSLVEGNSSPPVVDGTNGNIVGADPQIGSLQDNGGPTMTQALSFDSPAFNAGDPGFTAPPATDQRGSGFPRELFGRIDLGALEFQGPIPVSLSIAPDPATIPEDGSASATISACLPSGFDAVEDVAVTLAIVGTAVPGTDHDLANPTTAMIETGDNCEDVTLTAIDDNLDEVDETVDVAIDSLPASYSEGTPNQVSATILDNDAAGITVNPTSGLTTTEAGGTDTFDVVLTSRPTDTVTIPFSSDDTSEGTVGPASLSFTAADWDSPKTVTVTGVDDNQVDGDVAFNVISAPATSADPNYDGADPADVAVTNTDNETAGIALGGSASNGGMLSVSEDGDTDTFTVVLEAQPTADVTLGLTSDNLDEATVSPTSLAFTPGTWNSPQTITVTGVDDSIIDGDIGFSIVTAPATSADPAFDGIDPPDVAGVNGDNDVIEPVAVPTLGPLGLLLLPLLLPIAAWRYATRRARTRTCPQPRPGQ